MQETNTKIRILVGLNVVLMLIVAVLVFPVVGRNYMATTIGTNVSTAGLTATSSVTTPAVDNSGAVTLGSTNATSVGIGRTGVTSTVNGPLTVTQATTLNGATTANAALNVTGAPVTLTPSQTIASGASATWDGVKIPASTATITGSTGITTASGFNLFSLLQPILSAASTLTVSNAATLYIANAPSGAGSGPATITNPYALWVDDGDARFDGTVNLAAQTALTLATDAITVTKSYHTVDTEAAAASDDMVTINGGKEGDVLIIRPSNDARTVVAKNATGNLRLEGDFTMDDAKDLLTLFYDGSNWNELSRSAPQSIGARVYHSTTQTIPNTTHTYLVVDSERYDTDNIHSTSLNTGRLTANTPGVYNIGYFIDWASSATGNRASYIILNRTTLLASDYRAAVSGDTTSVHGSTHWRMSVNDYVELRLWHTQGTSFTLNTFEFWMQRIGD